MSIDQEDARKVAHLARIRVEESELPVLASEFNRIIGFIEEMNALDIGEVEPLTAVTDVVLPRREDQVTEGDQSERILANAPLSREGFFAVPKVVE